VRAVHSPLVYSHDTESMRIFETFICDAADNKLLIADMSTGKKNKDDAVAKLRQIRLWAQLHTNTTGPPFTEDQLVQWILGRMTVVQLDTVKRDISFVRKWGKFAVAAGILPPDWKDPCDSQAVKEAIRCAKRYGYTCVKSKLEITPHMMRQFFAATKSCTTWTAHMYRLTAAAAYGSLVRRQALASMKWKTIPGSNFQRPSPTSDIQFAPDGHIIESIAMAANFEKNQVRTVTTTRHFADDNCTELPLASVCRESLQLLHLTDGPMLRSTPASKEPAGKLFWHNFLCFFSTACGLIRPKYGMQSFRRGYAMALMNIGHLSIDELQAIGYWWSGAVKVYSGDAKNMRLNLQRKPEMREAYGEVTTSRAGAGGTR
jgi:hypothetical protein